MDSRGRHGHGDDHHRKIRPLLGAAGVGVSISGVQSPPPGRHHASATALPPSQLRAATIRAPLKPRHPNFPRQYHLTNEVTVSGAERTLAQELVVANPGAEPFSFTTALHTYFKVNALEATVGGLRGCKYLDSLDGRAEKVDLEEEVCFASEVDRIYMGVPRVVTVSDSSVNFDIGTTATLSDGIVWNPWIAKAASMKVRWCVAMPVTAAVLIRTLAMPLVLLTKDYGDEEWRDHVCHEAGRAASGPVTLAPGEVWSGTQTITAHISS